MFRSISRLVLSVVSTWVIWADPGALPAATTRFVDASNPNPQAPYTNWQTAANILQTAVFTAVAGDTILVTNGVYNQGRSLANPSRITLSKRLTLLSVNGPEFTTIAGYQDPLDPVGKASLRCITASAPVFISGFTLMGGGSDSDGGGILGTGSGIVLSNCIVEGNAAKVNGGGAYGVRLVSCILRTNWTVYTAISAGSYGGGAFACDLQNCLVENNSGYVGGGAAFCTLTRCQIWTNTAGVGGGVSSCTVTDSLIAGNVALAPSGGGGGSERSKLYRCRILQNRADAEGGGASGGRMGECVVMGNRAGRDGGGVSYLLATNCLIVGNIAGQSGGGAFEADLRHCTLADNFADEGGGVYSGSATHGIVYHNRAVTLGNNFSGNPILSFICTTPEPASATGVVSSDPHFVNAFAGNYRLKSDSPCIDAGDVLTTLSVRDADGRARVVGSKPDLGAYEFDPSVDGEFLAYLESFDLATDGSADAVDSDHDGADNHFEWLARTNPLDANSVLRWSSIQIDRSTGSVSLQWQSVPAVRYFLEYAGELNAGAGFTRIASGLVADSNLTSFLHQTVPPSGAGFYRLGLE